MRKLLFGLMLLVCSYNSFSQQVAKGLTASNGQFIGFYEYKPTNYNHYGKKYPLIIFLHGIGERGNGTSELHKLTWHAIPRIIQSGGTMTYRNPKTGEMETFLVLSPQLSYNYGYWDDFYIDEMLKYAKQNLNVDQSRIYLTGLSAGGGGTWRYPSGSLAHAQEFAAIAPVCPTCDWNTNTLPTTIVAGKVGVWSFHANDDNITSSYCTYGAVDAINTMNPATPAKKTIYPNGGHYIWEIVYTSNEVFEWFLGQSRGGYTAPAPIPTPNVAPVSKAGSDITITLPTNSTTLNNSGSYDPDGSIAAYKWSQGSGPNTANIVSYTSASTSITSLVAGTYTFHLTVTDNAGATNVDEVIVTVKGAVSGQPPVANAGNDESVPVGQATVLHGQNSTASAGIARYSWEKISGPSSYEILSPNASETWIRNMNTAGSYVYRLTVTDNNGASSTDDVVISVGTTAPSTTPPPPTNTAGPVVNAGKDESIPVGQATVLHGENSTASAGIARYSWAKISGPSSYEILSPNASETWIRNMNTSGSYVYRLTVTDNNGVSAYDDVVITVGNGGTQTPSTPTPPVNTNGPVVNAGADQNVPAGQATAINGDNTTAAAGIRTMLWSKVSGPASYEILAPLASSTWVRNMTAGVYVFRLTVTDNNGVTSHDDMVITVGGGGTSSSGGNGPVANAGKDETIPVGQATVLHGETSTAAAGIRSYTWTKYSGPAQYEMLTPNGNNTWIRNMVAGTYVYRLTVTDNNGVSSTDDVTINVFAGSSTASGSKQLVTVNETSASMLSATQPLVSFQNPVRNNLNLNWDAAYKGNAKISIVDMNGKTLKTMNVRKNQQRYSNNIDVNGLKQGMFLVQIQTEDGKTITEKFVKK